MRPLQRIPPTFGVYRQRAIEPRRRLLEPGGPDEQRASHGGARRGFVGLELAAAPDGRKPLFREARRNQLGAELAPRTGRHRLEVDGAPEARDRPRVHLADREVIGLVSIGDAELQMCAGVSGVEGDRSFEVHTTRSSVSMLSALRFSNPREKASYASTIRVSTAEGKAGAAGRSIGPEAPTRSDSAAATSRTSRS